MNILNDSDFRDWQNGAGNIMTAEDYKKERSLLITAANSLYNMVSSLVAGGTTVNTETFTATEGQTVFTLTGSYKTGTHTLMVDVGGVPQEIGSAVTETSSTSFTLSEGVAAGTKVNTLYFTNPIIVSNLHSSTHELGGSDELDVTLLAGYQANIADKITSNTTNITTNTNKIKDIEILSIMGVY